jgi:hypothetical protein
VEGTRAGEQVAAGEPKRFRCPAVLVAAAPSRNGCH